MKDFRRISRRSLRSQSPDWPERGIQFTLLIEGEVDLHGYVQILMNSVLPARWNELHGTKGDTMPLVAEAESAYVALDSASADGVKFVEERLCYEVAEGSFEDGMGS